MIRMQTQLVLFEENVKLLAFDTSTSACSVAVCDDSLVKQEHYNIPMQHGKMLLPMIHALLQKAHLQATQLDAIVYGAGPGSYTGIRIASSACQALAYAISKPVIQVSSLHALAQTAWQEYQYNNVIVLQDARMNEVYCAQYELNEGHMQPLVTDRVLPINRIIEHLTAAKNSKNQPIYAVGDGWRFLSQTDIEKLGIIHTEHTSQLMPSARALLELGKISYSKGLLRNPEEAQPIYLR